MAVRINLDRVEYREPRMREIRWSICSSIRKQTIRCWIIGLQFLPWIVSAAFCCDFILFSNTRIFGWGLVAAMMQYTALGSDLGPVFKQQHPIMRVATKSLNSVQMDGSETGWLITSR